ncbi:proteasome regulatory particle subunit [Marasmius sp. AFHP31]|nr:proteasome regulatory particle subunit [Marasmius sp. AFHP31]
MPSSESRLSEALSQLNPLRRRPSLAQSIRSISSAFSRKSKDRESIKSNWDAESRRSERSRHSFIAEVPEPKEVPKEKEVKKAKKPKKKAQTQPQAQHKPAPQPTDNTPPAFTSKKERKRQPVTHVPSKYKAYAVRNQPRQPAFLRNEEVMKKLLDTVLDLPGGRRSLSRLARTCRALSEPALNTLWRELDSLVPVVGLFPGTLLKKARKPGLGLAKAPEEEDWSRVMSYGERVRQITYNESSNALSPAIFPYFEENRPRVYMFPNLQHLVWKTETSAGLDYCNMFLNPSLEGLTLEIGARCPKLVPLLTDVAQRMTFTSFSFSSQISLPESFVDIMAAQDALQRLVIVAPGALAPAMGHWVASLPELKSLQLDLSRRSPIAVEGFFDELAGSGASTPSSVGTTDSGVFSGEELDFSDIRKSALRVTGNVRSREVFATMRQLHLTGEASNVAVFLKFFTSPLSQLDLVIDDPPDSVDWQDLSSMICRFSSSLQSLRITATSSSRYSDLIRSTPRAEQPTGRLPLEHLSHFPVLNRLEVDLPESFNFLAADIARVADCCPNLEELKLCPLARFPVNTGPPKLTLEALAPLMANCQRLHTISVAVNGMKGNPNTLAEPSFSSNSLRKCHLGHSWIGEPLHVAILLSHLAPKLDTLKWFHERNRPGFIETNARGWEKVSDMLPHLQQIRLTERIRSHREPEKVVEYVEVQVLPPEIPTSDKCVGPEVVMRDQSVLVLPTVAESSVQCSPQLAHASVEAVPELVSVEIDATPVLEEIAIDASVTTVDEIVDATPLTVEAPVDATPAASQSVEAFELVPQSPQQRYWGSHHHVIPSLFSMLSYTCKILIAFPLTIPMRLIHALMYYNPFSRRTLLGDQSSSDSSSSSQEEDNDDITMTTIQVR